jgi:uncharacterized protein with von Willebrand factor type A (vWA) domain
MLDLLAGFVQELRAAGVPVSMVEAIDAMDALRYTDLGKRDEFKAALGATLVKNEHHYDTFETVFEVYFSLHREAPEASSTDVPGLSAAAGSGRAGSGGEVDVDALVRSLFLALLEGDLGSIRALARQAVVELAGMEPGRPVGGTYYLYRTLRQIDVDHLLERLVADSRLRSELTPLQERLLREEYEARIEELRREMAAEIRRRLVADRGPEAVARTLRRPLLEDVDLMHATPPELKRLERAVHPLTRKLATRLARRRRRGRTGRLDFRRTIRSSLSTGGVPLEPRFRRPHPAKPEVFLICDISGSMSTFARFTLQFVYAMSSQFARLRSFVFIDALDEVTDAFRPGGDFETALRQVSNEAEVVWLDGHSDYGHALEGFVERYARDLTPRSTVILTGDARNNYRPGREDLLDEMRSRSKAIYWLNPEPVSYWDTGDSIMGRYAPCCDAVHEVRNLRQLEHFVRQITLPSAKRAA